MKRIIIVALLLIIVLGGLIAYRMFNETTPDIVNRKPDKAVTAKELILAFDSDTATASKNYLDKIVQVTGLVKKIDTTGSIILGEDGNPSEVVVGLDRRHMKDHEKISEGTMAVIQGVCSGYSKGDGDDMLASLGTTVQLRSAGVKD